MIWARGPLVRRFRPWAHNFMKIAIRPQKFIFSWSRLADRYFANLGREHLISWKLLFGRKNIFSHDLSSGTAISPISDVSTQFHENCDSAVKIDFLMIWARGALVSRFGPWAPACESMGREHPISWKLRFGRKNWFSHDLSSGSACGSIWAVSTQLHENCDSAVKIDFLMIWARGPLVRQFEPWAPNFMKITIWP